MKVKTFSKSQCSKLVKLLVAGNMCGQLQVLRCCADDMACLLISAIYCVLHLLYNVFDGISIRNICKNDGVYNIL